MFPNNYVLKEGKGMFPIIFVKGRIGFSNSFVKGEKGCFPIGLSRFVNIEGRGLFSDNFVKVCCIVGKMNFVSVNLFIKGEKKNVS